MPPLSYGKGHLPSLDGWRALSILLVLGNHSIMVPGLAASYEHNVTWLFDGGLGVRIFFLISGFLITTLMLREHAQYGRVSLRAFYLRRALRLLPVYGAFLLFVAALQWFSTAQQTATTWAHLLTFTVNFMPTRPWLIGHLWSLSCEEQFYFLWPPLLVFGGLCLRPKRAWIILCVPLVLSPLWRVVTYLKLFPSNPLFSMYSLGNVLDSLAIGCLLAFLHPALQARWRVSRPTWIYLAAAALILIPYVLEHNLKAGFITKPFRPLMEALGFSVLLSISIACPQISLFRLLNIPLVAWVGRLSYSLYIWQQFFCADPADFGWNRPLWQYFSTWLLPVFLTATASYYLVERPFLQFRKRWAAAAP